MRNLIRRLNRAEAYHNRKKLIAEDKMRTELRKEQDRVAVSEHPHFSNLDLHRVDYTYGIQDGIMAHCKDCDVEIKVR